MKVAVPIYRHRIAPHFGTAPEMLMLLVEKRRLVALIEIDWVGQAPAARRHKVIALGTEWLLCGGIEEAARRQLERHGVRVTADLKGPVAEVVTQILGVSTDQWGNRPARG